MNDETMTDDQKSNIKSIEEYDARIRAICTRLGIGADGERFPRIILDRALTAIVDRLDAIEAKERA